MSVGKMTFQSTMSKNHLLCVKYQTFIFFLTGKFSEFSQTVLSAQSLMIEVCLNIINIKENHSKETVLSEHCEKIENFTLKKAEISCRVKENSLCRHTFRFYSYK